MSKSSTPTICNSTGRAKTPNAPQAQRRRSVARRLRGEAMQEHVREHRPDLDADISEFVWRQEWVVHVQLAGSGREVLKYLARYVSRSAIGPAAIVSDDERGV